MEAKAASLDGIGFMRQTKPVDTAFAIMKAGVVSANGADTLYVLCIDGPMGTHVTYWSRQSMQQLRDQIDEAITGITVARDVPSRIIGGGDAH